MWLSFSVFSLSAPVCVCVCASVSLCLTASWFCAREMAEITHTHTKRNIEKGFVGMFVFALCVNVRVSPSLSASSLSVGVCESLGYTHIYTHTRTHTHTQHNITTQRYGKHIWFSVCVCVREEGGRGVFVLHCDYCIRAFSACSCSACVCAFVSLFALFLYVSLPVLFLCERE